MNNTLKVVLAVLGVLVLLFGVRVAITVSKKPDDQKLIREALDEAILASKEGRAGGVIELLSRDLKFNDQEVGTNKRQIMDFVQKQKPSVTVQDTNALLTGDEARIVSPVEIDLGLFGGKRNLKEVSLIFRKEDATTYLIFPARKWRLVEVRVPDATVADFLQ